MSYTLKIEIFLQGIHIEDDFRGDTLIIKKSEDSKDIIQISFVKDINADKPIYNGEGFPEFEIISNKIHNFILSSFSLVINENINYLKTCFYIDDSSDEFYFQQSSEFVTSVLTGCNSGYLYDIIIDNNHISLINNCCKLLIENDFNNEEIYKNILFFSRNSINDDPITKFFFLWMIFDNYFSKRKIGKAREKIEYLIKRSNYKKLFENISLNNEINIGDFKNEDDFKDMYKVFNYIYDIRNEILHGSFPIYNERKIDELRKIVDMVSKTNQKLIIYDILGDSDIPDINIQKEPHRRYF